MKTALVIFNPMAGIKKTNQNRLAIQNALNKKGYGYEWIETAPDDYQWHLEQFLNTKFDIILAVGGDGTAREAAAFIIRNNLSAPLGIIAQGTANLLAQSLAIPTNSLKQSVNFALTRQPQAIDAMKINNQHIGLVMAGIGYDSVFVKNASQILKRRYGFLAYILSFLKTFFIYSPRVFNIVLDGKTRQQVIGKFAGVFNTFALAKIKIGRHSHANDGILELAVFKADSIFDLCKEFITLFTNKQLTKGKTRILKAKKISITAKKNKHIQIDGEIFKAKNLQVEVLPKALKIVCGLPLS